MPLSHLIYGQNDTPPAGINFFLGFQHVCIIAISFIFPVLLVREAGGTEEQATFMVSMSMLAGAVGVVAQALRRGPVGSGYLCPQVCGPSYISSSILAAHVGGLPLVFGMTAFAGVFEAFFSRILSRLRPLFPTEVTGLIVAMVGITVVKLAGKNFLGLGMGQGQIHGPTLAVALACLACMIGFNVWTKGRLKLFCILIGMITGYAASFATGLLTWEQIEFAAARPLVWMPLALHPGWAFDLALVPPIIIAVICSSLKSVGDLTTCQKTNDSGWVRPDMDNIKKGILADAVGCFSAGVLGGMGQSTSSTNVGLSIATGATSRVIALSTGSILAVLAFCPKLTALFAVMPEAVVGATLIFALSFMVVAGMQIIMSRMIDARKTFVIGVSMLFGLLVDMMPEQFAALPSAIQPIFCSSLSASTIIAIVMNLIMRIGIRKTATLEVNPDVRLSEQVFNFLHKQGSAWGARPEIIHRASSAATEYLEALAQFDAGPASLAASFDEFNLNLAIRHTGSPAIVDGTLLYIEDILDDPDAFRRMAGTMVCTYADKLAISESGRETVVSIHLDH